MNPRGLTALGIDTLNHSVYEMYQLFNILADENNYPCLIHCTQGKDRTGLLVILVLLLCSNPTPDGNTIPISAMKADYMASEPALVAEREERLSDIRAMGLDDEFAGCPEGFVEAVIGWLGEQWGGVEGYLGGMGFGAEMRGRVRRNLLVAEEVGGQ